MKLSSFARPLSLILLVAASSFLSGCSTEMNVPDTQGTSDFGTIHGGAFGGQQPLTGAQVYIFEAPSAGNPGYGNTAPVSLIGHAGSSVTCDASVSFPIIYNSTTGFCSYQTGGYNGGMGTNNLPSGEFQLSGIYKCDIGQNVWLYSVGGYTLPGGGTAQNNPYATLMADLGPCKTGDFTSDTFIYMNELSTTAMAYALAGFTGDTSVVANTGVNTLISAPTRNAQGFNNAFLNAQQLYNIFGLTDQPDLSAPQTTTAGARNGVPPFYLINTVGDALAACINSTNNGSGTPSSNCKNLFVDAYSLSNPPITDTASAAFYLAQHPASKNTTNLLSLANTNPVWLPNFASGGAPANFNDFSAAIVYSQATISPKGIVTDKDGNVVVNNITNVVKLSPLGALTSSAANTVAGGAGIAVDSVGYIWATATNKGLYKFPAALTAPTKTTPLTNLDSDPIAVDKSGYIYIADPGQNGGEIYKTNAAGNSSTITYTAVNALSVGCVKAANGIALDGNGALWVTGTGNTNNRGSVCHLNNAGTSVLSSTGIAKIPGPTAVAVDSSNNAWVVDNAGNAIYKVTDGTGGVATVSNAFGGGGLSGNPSAGPIAVTIDGAGNVWTVNYNPATSFSSISELSSTGVGISDSNNGFQGGNISEPSGLSIDISGNLWVSNTAGGGVVEVVGIAAPTAPYSAMAPGTRP